MPRPTAFWDFFEREAAPKLALREETFRKAFEYLDTFEGPVVIVETGCARKADNWSGDGQSTLLFDAYLAARDDGSVCYSVDINPTSVAACRELVSERIRVTQDDSVHFLKDLVERLRREGKVISLAYLDSFDVDFVHWYPSAIHHLKELVALMKGIDERTLVMVDDCPLQGRFVQRGDGQVTFRGGAGVGGKGVLVAEYAGAVGARLEFAGYQAGWIGF